MPEMEERFFGSLCKTLTMPEPGSLCLSFWNVVGPRLKIACYMDPRSLLPMMVHSLFQIESRYIAHSVALRPKTFARLAGSVLD
jgi:hypothetical protein